MGSRRQLVDEHGISLYLCWFIQSNWAKKNTPIILSHFIRWLIGFSTISLKLIPNKWGSRSPYNQSTACSMEASGIPATGKHLRKTGTLLRSSGRHLRCAPAHRCVHLGRAKRGPPRISMVFLPVKIHGSQGSFSIKIRSPICGASVATSSVWTHGHPSNGIFIG